ncbi:MAG: hypothetical protein H6512_12045 [Acidimicrobiia bacterium]|nr:hypothetical protein [Acidimicrobiia bacterium]
MPSPENMAVSSDYSDFPTVEEMVANSTAIALIELEEPLLEIPIDRSAGDDDVATVQMNVAQRFALPALSVEISRNASSLSVPS